VNQKNIMKTEAFMFFPFVRIRKMQLAGQDINI